MSYQSRHIGLNSNETSQILNRLQFNTLDDFIAKILPVEIKRSLPLQTPDALSEDQFLKHLSKSFEHNKPGKALIGQGYAPSLTPPAIQRYFFENPGWYTAYTPYQAEIAQGRLELLFHFQSLVCDLTQLPISNASLLDESTALAEAMGILFRNRKNKDARKFVIASKLYAQHYAVLKTRASGLDIELICLENTTEWQNFKEWETVFGACLQYPNAEGLADSETKKRDLLQQKHIPFIICSDLFHLLLLESPAELGADIAVGSAQRFGIPLGFGGPHAAYIATKESYKRQLPGRIIGLTKDKLGNPAYRMALQTREQHIRREKATSNICTAQALLAMMAALYAIYHGPQNCTQIATDIHQQCKKLHQSLSKLGYKIVHNQFIDTLRIKLTDIHLPTKLQEAGFYVFQDQDHIQITVYEGFSAEDLEALIQIFKSSQNKDFTEESSPHYTLFPQKNILSAKIFNTYHSELKFMRFLKNLENKDLSLTHSMIALGSCTMKLNPSAGMQLLTNPKLANIHPLSPQDSHPAYSKLIDSLGTYLCDITELNGVSFQPNSGAQGEYAGLMAIKAYFESKNETHRKIMLIPSSAHGTNPASAQMAGFEVVSVACDAQGNIDPQDLDSKINKFNTTLAGIMITYPSTFGVFERNVEKVCKLIHDAGAQVYMDGANLNAQVGLTSPGIIGADVCHINLHKTFCIPHGGGGPGMGPICVKSHLIPFLPGNPQEGLQCLNACSASHFGSASILSISYAAICMLGKGGLKKATEIALLNANYMAHRLKDAYPILFKGPNGYVAHEFIIDCRSFKKSANIEVEDIAKRLMDYGFHAPTMSWPVAGCLMIEPTESENLEELDLFCDALIRIRTEIKAIEEGLQDTQNNLLKNAPHSQAEVIQSLWPYDYSREEAAYPLGIQNKRIWPSVSRIDNAYGDRNLVCSCDSLQEPTLH